MSTHLLFTSSNAPVERGLANPTTDIARFLIFSRADKCSKMLCKAIAFAFEPGPAPILKNFFFHSRFGAKAKKCQAHVLGNLAIFLIFPIKILIAWPLIPAALEKDKVDAQLSFSFL